MFIQPQSKCCQTVEKCLNMELWKLWSDGLRVLLCVCVCAQEKWMQCRQQNEWSDAPWEHVRFYREVVSAADSVIDPKIHQFYIYIYNCDLCMPLIY